MMLDFLFGRSHQVHKEKTYVVKIDVDVVITPVKVILYISMN